MNYGYARQHIINKNEFIKSLIEQYDWNQGGLSSLQESYLTDAEDRHRKTKMWLRNYQSLNCHNQFYQSLKSQFEERGFLTDKQLDSMKKYLH